MMKVYLTLATVTAVLIGDTMVQARWHQPEQPVQQLDRSRKGARIHLDVWVIEHGPARLVCVMGPCRTDRAAGDLRD